MPATGIRNNADNGILVNLDSTVRNAGNPLFPPDLLIDSNTADNNGLNGIQVNNTGANNLIVITNNTTTANSNHFNGYVLNNVGTWHCDCG